MNNRSASKLSTTLQQGVGVEFDGGETGALDHDHLDLLDFRIRCLAWEIYVTTNMLTNVVDIHSLQSAQSKHWEKD